jgi:5'-methylthioadenosine phosphorylase
LKKVDLGLIGGTGTEAILGTAEQIRVGTPYGLAPPIFIGEIGEKTVAFLPRHGVDHSVPPHKINYRANIYALHSLGAKRVIATNAAGAINPEFKPGDLVIPDDLIDFTRLRANTFYDDAPVTHIDVCETYCPEVRNGIIKAAERKNVKAFTKAVFVCSEGPRFETPAEIRMLERLGGDLVGMTGMPETVLAHELGMCYATVCIVTNMAAGLGRHLPTNDMVKIAKKTAPVLQQVLRETALHLPEKRQCQCAHALEEARFKG